MKRSIPYWQRLLVTLLIFGTVTLGFPFSAFGETNPEFAYTLENGEITITQYSGNGEHLEIPSVIEGVPVTAIGQYAFKDRNRLVSVTVPESVTVLEWRGFYDCIGLTSVTFLGNGLLTVGREAFHGCTALSQITLPDSVTSVGQDAVKDTAYYKNSDNWEDDVLYVGNHLVDAKDTVHREYTVKPGTKTIAAYAFERSQILNTVTLPEGLVTIGEYAFNSCLSLAAVNIPGSVTYWGMDAFAWCEKLSLVTIGTGITIIPYGTFSGCSSLSFVEIPGTVTIIEEHAFSNTALEKVTLPESVTTIERQAFDGCRNLTEITLPQGITEIAPSLFFCCESLASVEIPKGVTTIGESAFWGCKSLTQISLPEQVTVMEDSAFQYCESLKEIELPNHVLEIGAEAFDDTAYYKEETNWQDGVLYIDTHLVGAKGGLTEHYQVLPSTTDIAASAFSTAGWNLKTVTVPPSVAFIGKGAFRGYSQNVVLLGTAESIAHVYASDPKNKITFYQVNENGVILGDVNEDIAVNAIDALEVLKFTVEKTTFTPEQQEAGDVNSDGAVNGMDALWILHRTVQKIQLFPVNG